MSEHYEEEHHIDVRLLRPYYPDGTSIATPLEEHHLRVAAEAEIERLRAHNWRTDKTIRHDEPVGSVRKPNWVCSNCVHKGFREGSGSVRKPNLPSWENN